MPNNILADIFALTEEHDVTISLSYDKAFRHYRIRVCKNDLEANKYFWPGNGNPGNEAFIFNLITFMIYEIEAKEKERKNG
jgi:hypothetical protein